MIEKDNEFKDIDLCKKILAENQKTELELVSNFVGNWLDKEELINAINLGAIKSLATNANEHCKIGLERMELKEWKRAYASFKRWLDNKDYHIINLYGAGTAKKFLWEDKEAKEYFTLAYKIATHESMDEIASKIGLEIAKIDIKNWQTEQAKKQLDTMIWRNVRNIEAYLLKARMMKKLGQKKEFEVVLEEIYKKTIEEDNDFSLTENYEDIFEYIYKKIDSIIEKEIERWGTPTLIKNLLKVEKIGYKQGTKNILWQILKENPIDLKKSWIQIKDILQRDKIFFNKIYKEIASKKYLWGQSIYFFSLAHLWYQYIDFSIIKQIIKTGLDFDIDYIYLKNERDIQKKKMYLENIKNKIYALGDNAKYMLRDYLKKNPGSLLNF